MNKPDDTTSKAILNTDTLVDDMVKRSNVYPNLALGILVITEDKVKICLREFLDRMGRRSRWLTPCSALLTIVLAFMTADFRQRLGLPAETWQAFFLFFGVAMLVWLAIALIGMGKSVSIEEIIKELKKESETAVESVGAQGAYWRALREGTLVLEHLATASEAVSPEDLREQLRKAKRHAERSNE